MAGCDPRFGRNDPTEQPQGASFQRAPSPFRGRSPRQSPTGCQVTRKLTPVRFHGTAASTSARPHRSPTGCQRTPFPSLPLVRARHGAGRKPQCAANARNHSLNSTSESPDRGAPPAASGWPPEPRPSRRRSAGAHPQGPRTTTLWHWCANALTQVRRQQPSVATNRCARREGVPPSTAPQGAQNTRGMCRKTRLTARVEGGTPFLQRVVPQRVVPAGKLTQSPVANGHPPRQGRSK